MNEVPAVKIGYAKTAGVGTVKDRKEVGSDVAYEVCVEDAKTVGS